LELGRRLVYQRCVQLPGPIGTKVIGTANPDFWTFSPAAAISYLSANWNLSANLVYNVYTASQGFTGTLGGTPFANGWTDGNQFAGDLHALYKMGKWSFGPVGYFVLQTTADALVASVAAPVPL